jgi:mono/diheme cytochrome c family protein
MQLVLIFTYFFLCSPAYADMSEEDIYEKYCAACHGQNGEGTSITGFSLSERLGKTDEELSNSIEKGKGAMPPWGFILSTEDIKNVLQYLRENFTNETNSK